MPVLIILAVFAGQSWASGLYGVVGVGENCLEAGTGCTDKRKLVRFETFSNPVIIGDTEIEHLSILTYDPIERRLVAGTMTGKIYVIDNETATSTKIVDVLLTDPDFPQEMQGQFLGPLYLHCLEFHTFTGDLSKGNGSFLIDHPLDPENKILRHNFVESPENLLVYRGKAKLNDHGETTVNMPDYFEALADEEDGTVTLTPIGKPFLTGYEWQLGHTSFRIHGESGREVSWVVYANRDDPVIHQLARPVEEMKGRDYKLCQQGELLYPAAYGYPASMGKDHKEMEKTSEEKKRKGGALE